MFAFSQPLQKTVGILSVKRLLLALKFPLQLVVIANHIRRDCAKLSVVTFESQELGIWGFNCDFGFGVGGGVCEPSPTEQPTGSH